MYDMSFYILVGILTLLCIQQEWIRRKAIKKYPNTQDRDRLRFRISWVLYVVFLVWAAFFDVSIPVILFGLGIIGLAPYFKTTYTDLCIQYMKILIFMTMLLILHGWFQMGGIEIQNMERYPTNRVMALCTAELAVVLFTGKLEEIYQSYNIQEHYDKKNLRIFSWIMMFCYTYVFADGLLCLLDMDTMFVPLTMIAGNILILLLMTVFFHYNCRLLEEEKVKQEYQQLEMEKAQQSWQEQKLLKMARQDTLTGAFSRRYVMEKLKEFAEKNIPCTVVYIDMDDMKQVNDGWGHAAGDHYLKSFAEQLQELLPQTAFLARMGGDEFLAVFAEAGLCEVSTQMKQMESALESYSFSYGIASADETEEDLIQQADRMMYEAKKRKKGGETP